MQVTFQNQPGSTAARLVLQPGEVVTAEAGAMIAMSGHMQMTTTTHKKQGGGLFKAAKRLIAGESLFLNHYECAGQPAEVWLAATLPGDMMTYELEGETLIVQAGSFVACEEGVEVDLGWQGFKSLFSGESVFWLRLSGRGKVVINSYGAIYPVQVNGAYIVDTGHIVAFNESLTFEITKAGKSLLSSFMGGEGLVCRFKGHGRVWVQSHNPPSFGRILGPALRPR